MPGGCSHGYKKLLAVSIVGDVGPRLSVKVNYREQLKAKLAVKHANASQYYPLFTGLPRDNTHAFIPLLPEMRHY